MRPIPAGSDAADQGARSLRTLFVVPQGADSPGPRYRVFQFLPRYREMGFDVRVMTMQGPRSTRRSIESAGRGPAARAAHVLSLGLQTHLFMARVCARVPAHDRVFLYRIPIPRWSCRLLGRYRDRLLFDFDDALDIPESDGGVLQALRTRFLRSGLAHAVSVCTLTIASNRRNAERAREMGGRAVVVPTVVDLDRAILRDRSVCAGASVVLGWIGTPSTAKYLPLIEGALLEVSARRNVTIRLVGAGRNPFSRLVPDVLPWQAASEAADIAGFDVGLMPMPDTPWTRGKAALKALEYGASGAPTAASWTPTNAEILGEEHGALLCRTHDDWAAALSRLVDDARLRSVLGGRARRRVEAEFSTRVVAPVLGRLIAAPSEETRTCDR